MNDWNRLLSFNTKFFNNVIEVEYFFSICHLSVMIMTEMDSEMNM